MYIPERYRQIIDAVDGILSEFNIAQYGTEFGGRYRSYHLVNDDSLWLEIVDEMHDDVVDSIRIRDGFAVLYDYDADTKEYDYPTTIDMSSTESVESMSPKRKYREDDPRLAAKVKRWCRQAIRLADHKEVLKPYIKYNPDTD